MVFDCNKIFFKNYFIVQISCKPQSTRGLGCLAVILFLAEKKPVLMKPFTAKGFNQTGTEIRCPCGF